MSVARQMNYEESQLDLYVTSAMAYFHEAVCAREDRDFKRGLQLIMDGHFPLEESQRLARRLKNQEQTDEVAVLFADYDMIMCTLKSLQAMNTGETEERAFTCVEWIYRLFKEI